MEQAKAQADWYAELGQASENSATQKCVYIPEKYLFIILRQIKPSFLCLANQIHCMKYGISKLKKVGPISAKIPKILYYYSCFHYDSARNVFLSFLNLF